MKNKLFLKILIATVLVLMTTPVIAQSSYSVPVAWNSTGSSNNWKLYLSSGAAPFATLNVTNVQNAVLTGSGTNFTVNATLTGLPLNTVNRLYVTAVDKTSGLEGPPSNVLTNSVNIPQAPFNFTVTGPITIQGPITISGVGQ